MEQENLESRFRRLMPRSKYITLIVLKGHLLMEENLNALLKSMVPSPSALDSVQLSVFARLQIVRALMPFQHDILDAAEKLNALRNKLAHHLEHPKIEILTVEFIEAFGRRVDEEEDIRPLKLHTKLKRCIIAICSFFCGMQIGYEVVGSKRI